MNIRVLKKIFIGHSFFWWLLFATIVPLLIMAYLSTHIAETALKNEVNTSLSILANNKATNIERFIQKSKQDASLLAKAPVIIAAVNNIDRQDDLKNQLVSYAKAYSDQAGYKNLMLISPSGKILFSLVTPKIVGQNLLSSVLTNTELVRTFNNASTLLETQMSDFYSEKDNEVPRAYIATPIFDQQSFIGVLVLQIDNAAITKVVSDPEGLGKTGETLAGNVKYNSIIPAVPLRHTSIADFIKLSPTIDPSLLKTFRNSTRGEHGAGILSDFPDHEVIGVWRYLPSLGWGMLIKIDTSEAFSSIDTLQRNMFILVAFSISLCLLIAYLVGSRLQKSENKLTRTLSELKVARDQALEADRTKSTFLANMSHELRTPLNAIIGYSEMLMEDAESMDLKDFTQDLTRIHGAGKYLSGLINDVLDISKIEAGKMEIYLEEINLYPVIEEISNIIQPLIKKNKNKLKIMCEPEIGKIYTDVTKIRQMLFNLLSNASKFTSNGLITLSVNRIINNNEEWVSFEVKDNGIGMSSDQLDYLFEAFTQADASIGRRFGGTGLGLYITKSFVHMLGGNITVSSQEDKGSTFTIILPAKPNNYSRKLNEETASNPTATESSSKKILVIDDDFATHNFIKDTLIENGFEVIHAQNGKEGLSLAKAKKPVIIILDVVMPEMDGWSVLGALKSDSELRNIPVIMLSIIADKDLGFSLGATDFLTKPVQPSVLTETLSKYLKNKPAKILVVEDDEDAREIIVRNLNKTIWSITEAKDGLEALNEIKKSPPSIILLDLMMPKLDGFEVVEELKKNKEWSNIPVIIITSKQLTKEEQEKLQGGVKLILRKGSYNRKELLSAIQKQINNTIRKIGDS